MNWIKTQTYNIEEDALIQHQLTWTMGASYTVTVTYHTHIFMPHSLQLFSIQMKAQGDSAHANIFVYTRWPHWTQEVGLSGSVARQSVTSGNVPGALRAGIYWGRTLRARPRRASICSFSAPPALGTKETRTDRMRFNDTPATQMRLPIRITNGATLGEAD